jgi:hypothetical protein
LVSPWSGMGSVNLLRKPSERDLFIWAHCATVDFFFFSGYSILHSLLLLFLRCMWGGCRRREIYARITGSGVFLVTCSMILLVFSFNHEPLSKVPCKKDLPTS